MPFCNGQADNNIVTLDSTGGWNVTGKATADASQPSSAEHHHHNHQTSSRMISASYSSNNSATPSWSFRSFPTSSHAASLHHHHHHQGDERGDESSSHAYIAEALQNMSLQDRDQVYHEVHGVEEVMEETPEFLKKSFDALQKELQVLVSAFDENKNSRHNSNQHNNINCGPLVRAQLQDYDYVHSPFFYKAFLRAERFDAKAAAIRMVRFFDMKAWCFGANHQRSDDGDGDDDDANSDQSYLCQDITQAMLTPGDLASMRRGCNQVLPRRDRSGRCLYLNSPHLTHFESPESLGRMYMYENWSMAQDEDTQRRGVALISFESGDHPRPVFDMALVPVAVKALLAAPVKYVVLHHCFSDERFKFITQMGLKLLPRHFRARNKLHFGTQMECLYTLLGFGIPDHALPFNVHRELILKPHHDWIQMRATQEKMMREGKLRSLTQIRWGLVDIPAAAAAADHGRQRGNNQSSSSSSSSYHQSPMSIVIVPSLSDILLGRGTTINAHHGNMELRRLVDAAVPEYEAGRRAKKTELTQQIVQTIKEERGGRFLKQQQQLLLQDQDDHSNESSSSSSSGVWLVMDDETARLKVSHLFRSRRELVLKALSKKKKKKKDPGEDTHKNEDCASSKEEEWSTKRLRVTI